jgi:hypothetical protein
MAARGSLVDPLSDHDIEAKLRDCSRLSGTAWDSDAIIEDVWRLDTLAGRVKLDECAQRRAGPEKGAGGIRAGSYRGPTKLESKPWKDR